MCVGRRGVTTLTADTLIVIALYANARDGATSRPNGKALTLLPLTTRPLLLLLLHYARGPVAISTLFTTATDALTQLESNLGPNSWIRELF